MEPVFNNFQNYIPYPELLFQGNCFRNRLKLTDPKQIKINSGISILNYNTQSKITNPACIKKGVNLLVITNNVPVATKGVHYLKCKTKG